MDKDFMSLALDELYDCYEADHSMKTVMYIHPMFQNGTFSENNEYQPDDPKELLTKEDFVHELNNETEFGEKWSIALQVLFSYMLKQNING